MEAIFEFIVEIFARLTFEAIVGSIFGGISHSIGKTYFKLRYKDEAEGNTGGGN